jgi:hypothetical protein
MRDKKTPDAGGKMASHVQRQQHLRVVYVTSLAARFGSLHWDGLQVCSRSVLISAHQHSCKHHFRAAVVGCELAQRQESVACPGFMLMSHVNDKPALFLRN